jgi:hypothetical protein
MDLETASIPKQRRAGRGERTERKPTPRIRLDQTAHRVGHVDTGAVSTFPALYHFTCDHRAPSILAVGALVPMRHYWLPEMAPVVWLTDDPEPQRDDVGLTSHYLECDRMAHRFRVIDTSACVPWSTVRGLGPRSSVVILESFGRPETWWISTASVPVVLG